MMTNDERRKVFWLLKKYSSYTAWKALGDAYAAFADAWMEAMRQATFENSEEQSWHADHTKSILDGRIAFEKGLQRLCSGDRSVWRENARGFLSKACDQVVFANQITDEREFVLDWARNKNALLRTRDRLDESFNRLGSINERPKNMAAALGSQSVFDAFWGPFNFPPAVPEPPTPSKTTILTGDAVPADGIYEPEWGDISPAPSASLFGKIKTAISGKADAEAQPDEHPRLANIGCMNYLLAGTSAPPYQDGELEQPRAVTWRLIWKDDRYLDGTIPPEEAQYLAEPAEPDIQRLRCEAPNPCPREGWWHTPAQPGSRRFFKTGELMPDLRTDYGATIWEWDAQQG